MANYSQAPYGIPFMGGATQQPYPTDPRNAASAGSYQQNSNLPGLGMTNFPQTPQPSFQQFWAQQYQNQQSAYPPVPFPPHPFLGQNGVPLPPPLAPPAPNATAYYPPAAQPAPIAPAPARIHHEPVESPQQYQNQTSVAAGGRVSEIIDSDKEDGELSEKDQMSVAPQSPDNIGDFKYGGGGVNGTVADRGKRLPREDNHRSPMRDLQTLLNMAPNRLSEPQREQSSNMMSGGALAYINPEFLRDRREEGKGVISFLNTHGIGYETLSHEQLDNQLLRRYYEELNISTKTAVPSLAAQSNSGHAAAPKQRPAIEKSSDPKVSPHQPILNTVLDTSQRLSTTVPTPSHSEVASQGKPLATLKTNVGQAQPVRSAPSPVDRQSYIARLQAAKKGKQSTAAKGASPEDSPGAAVPTVIPTAQSLPVHPPPDQPSPSGTPIAESSPAPQKSKREIQTELVRKRMELLKKSAQTPTSPAPRVNSPPTVRPNGDIQQPLEPQLNAPQSSVSSNTSSFGIVHGNNGTFPQTMQTASFSGIPGLFMTEPSTVPATLPPSHAQAPTLEEVARPTIPPTRKRPVAADFLEDDTPERPSVRRASGFARPFGQNNHDHTEEKMIIEVSDDESDGSLMDTEEDDPAYQPKSSQPPLRDSPSASKKQVSLRNLPPLSDFPSRPTSVKPRQSSVSTPSAAQTPARTTYEEEYNRKQEQIAKVKARIAELERQKTMRKPIPAGLTPTVASLASKNASVVPSVAPSTPQPEQPAAPVVSSQVETLPPMVQAVTVIDEKPSSQPDALRMRRAEIESSIASMDAVIASSAAQLEQIQREQARLQEERRKFLQDKENLTKELESLGIDTEGMDHAELKAKKDEVLQNMEIEAASSQDVTRTEQPIVEIVDETTSADAPRELRSTSTSDRPARSSVDEPDVTNREDAEPDPSSQPGFDAADDSGEEMDMSELESDTPDYSPEHFTTGISLPGIADIGEAPISIDSEKVTATVSTNATPSGEDADDFYSPEPAASPQALILPKAVGEQDHHAEHSGERRSASAIGGEDVRMLESPEDEGDDYEPGEVGAFPSDVPSQHVPIEIESSSASSLTDSSMSDDNDDEEVVKEAAETEGLEAPAPPNLDSNQLIGSDIDGVSRSELQPEDEEDDYEPLDIVPANASLAQPVSFREYQPEPFQNKLLTSSTDDASPAVADDLAPEIQPGPEQQVHASPDETISEELARFVPYESALRQFKSFRYHPYYTKDVPGGFQSMTYSHQIDPLKALCPSEATGETCNDPQCKNQHFREMGLSGERLLVQLGTGNGNPGTTKEEREKWNDGLRHVLRELRLQDTKDPEVVALQIAKYRREFLQDDTRVINLDVGQHA